MSRREGLMPMEEGYGGPNSGFNSQPGVVSEMSGGYPPSYGYQYSPYSGPGTVYPNVNPPLQSTGHSGVSELMTESPYPPGPPKSAPPLGPQFMNESYPVNNPPVPQVAPLRYMGNQNTDSTYNNTKPQFMAPVPVGNTTEMGMGLPPKERTICGLRRKVFFIILGVIALLIIAGLGAGLGIALTRNKGNSNSSQADRDRDREGAGAGGTSSTSILPSPTTSAPSVPPITNPIDPLPTSEPTPSESSIIEPTTTEEPTTSEEPTTTEEPTEEPTTSEEPTTEFTDFPTTSEDISTPTTSPEPSSTPIIDDPITETTSSPSTPSRPPTPTTSVFTLETGYNTLDVTLASTSGNADLCSLILEQISATTTVYPYLDGNPEDLYTAYWTLDNYPSTLTATGVPPQPTEDFTYWTFPVLINNDAGGCRQEGGDSFALEESGIAIYTSGFTLLTQCTFGGFEFAIGDFCYVSWLGTYSF